ncbi:Alpha/Beta hydrolase protein [Absidia repens]|uniref:Alpha/Beta hydrolase protein n=1 Tax=Absidia repens TaxID=90262 RepID=A0A1X2ITE3_9FUNG|nr:Alpha/Beta hydrolase protein [Absidia repens]
MYKYYFVDCIIALIFLVNTACTLPTILPTDSVITGSLPALIQDRIQMPSGNALSSLEQEEKRSHDVKPEAVPQETVSYLKSLIEILKAVYCTSASQDGEWKCAYCQKQTTLLLHFHSSISNGFTGIVTRDDSKKTFYLLFAGTKSVQNVVTDLQYVPLPYPPVGQGTKIHKGMYDSYITKQKTIQIAMLDEMSRYPEYQVVVMGHSLGAGIATIAAFDLYQRNKFLNGNNLHLVTAGDPAIGNREFSYYAAGTNIDIIRLTQKNDIVSGTSDTLKLTGFVHIGKEYWIQDAKSILVCPSKFETPNCIKSTTSNPLRLTTAFSDHLIYFDQRISQCTIDESLGVP